MNQTLDDLEKDDEQLNTIITRNPNIEDDLDLGVTE